MTKSRSQVLSAPYGFSLRGGFEVRFLIEVIPSSWEDFRSRLLAKADIRLLCLD
jgi:hypothetical protein